MPRNYEDRIKGRDFKTDSRQTAQTQVMASPVNTYVQPGKDPLFALTDALSSLQPSLKAYQEKDDKKERLLGEQGAMRGESTEGKSVDWVAGHMSVSGKTKGIQDAATLREKFNTEFDKDGGQDVNQWLQQEYAKMTQGNTDEDFLTNYQQAFAPLYTELGATHKKYIVDKVTTDGESNALQLMDGGIRAYVDAGQPVPVAYYDEMRKYLGGNLGVSNARFNDLMFDAIKRIGDEGNFQVYETLKDKKPDGTPGMYFIPEWKQKIDAAQIHAQAVYLKKRDDADKALDDEREDKQDTALMEVFLETDPKKASVLWKKHVANGLFTKASDLFAWQKKVEEHVDGKPSVDQQENEIKLIKDIMSRKAKVKDIIDANITLSQRRYLLNELESARTTDRTIAAQADKNANKVFKSTEFTAGEDYIMTMLASAPSPTDVMGVGSQFERQQRGAARLEFAKRAQSVSDPYELNAIREEIVDRYLKRRKEIHANQKGLPQAGRLRYSTWEDALNNADKMSPSELRLHKDFFMNQGQPK